MTTTHRFTSWDEAHRAGFHTRTSWRRSHHRTIKANATCIDALIHGRTYALYEKQQTGRMGKHVWSRGYLLDLFVGFPKRFKITTADTCPRILELTEHDLYGSPRRAIERGFNLRCCQTGISLARYSAESFHIYGNDPTQFFVLDLDLHNPTRGSITSHLMLVKAIEKTLPKFLPDISGNTFFFQYRTVPSGIQIWVVLKKKLPIKYLFPKVRTYLCGLGEDLNQELKGSGLVGLENIEILPTLNHTVSMVGAYGKEIFTDGVLRPKNGLCDVVGLQRYLNKGKRPKSVLERYRSLLEATALDGPAESQDLRVANAANTKSEQSKSEDGYVKDLFKKALEGVSRPDVLFAEYLCPLGQFLYFRDLRDDPFRIHKTVEALVMWVKNKHNGNVSRVLNNQTHIIQTQIHSFVSKIEQKTGESLKDWYKKLAEMDKRYPQHYQSLLDYMRNDSKDTQTILFTNCKRQEKTHKPLAQNKLRQLPEEIEKILSTTIFKTPKTRYRLKAFAARFLPLLYPDEATVSDATINSLLGVKSRQAALPYKKELRRLGLIKGNWSRFIVRGKRCSLYQLTEMATEAFAAIAEDHF